MIYKTIGSGGDYANFTGPSGLFKWITDNGLADNITLTVISDLSEPGSYALSKTGLSYTIEVYPDSANMRTVSGNIAAGLLKFSMTSGVTIDGRYNGSGMYLTFKNTSTSTSSATIHFLNGGSNITFKYCYIKGDNYCVWWGTSTAAAGNINNTIDHCIISLNATKNAAAYHIYGLGSSGKINSGGSITNCEFITNGIGAISITTYAGIGWTITGNSIYSSATITVAAWTGINFVDTSSYGNTISGNYIGGTAAQCGSSVMTYNPTATATLTGIYISMEDSTSHTRNIVWDNIMDNLTLAGTGSAVQDSVIFMNHNGGYTHLNRNIVRNVVMAGVSNFFGIRHTSVLQDSLIENSSVYNITQTASGYPNFYGIYVKTGIIRKCKIYAITHQAGSTPSTFGILLLGQASTTSTVANNFIYLDPNSLALMYGIQVSTNSATFTGNIYYNTVYLNGTPGTGRHTYCFADSYSGPAGELKNNIFTNNISAGGTSGYQNAISLVASSSLTSNYNAVIATNYSAGTCLLAGVQKTWAQWQSAGYDANGVNVAAVLTSSSDPHLVAGSNGTIESAGTSVSSVIDDIDFQLRPTSTPDIGCDQRNNITFNNALTYSWNV